MTYLDLHRERITPRTPIRLAGLRYWRCGVRRIFQKARPLKLCYLYARAGQQTELSNYHSYLQRIVVKLRVLFGLSAIRNVASVIQQFAGVTPRSRGREKTCYLQQLADFKLQHINRLREQLIGAPRRRTDHSGMAKSSTRQQKPRQQMHLSRRPRLPEIKNITIAPSTDRARSMEMKTRCLEQRLNAVDKHANRVTVSGPRTESYNLHKTEIRQMLFRHTQGLLHSRRSSLRHLKTRIERTRETRRFREIRLLRERSELRVKQARSSRSETVRTNVKYRQPQFRLEKRIQPVEVVYQKRQEVLPPQIVEPT